MDSGGLSVVSGGPVSVAVESNGHRVLTESCLESCFACVESLSVKDCKGLSVKDSNGCPNGRKGVRTASSMKGALFESKRPSTNSKSKGPPPEENSQGSRLEEGDDGRSFSTNSNSGGQCQLNLPVEVVLRRRNLGKCVRTWPKWRSLKWRSLTVEVVL